MPMQELSALITAAGHLTNVAKTALQTHTQVEVDKVRIELSEAAIELTSKMTALQASHLALLESNQQLKQQIAAFDRWAQESDRYTLIPVSRTGAVVYALKTPAPSEALHWICPSCFEDRRKSILQPDVLNQYRCPTCKTIVIATKEFPKVDGVQSQNDQAERIDPEAKQMLVRYAQAPRGITLEDAIAGLNLSTAKADYLLDQLLKRKYIRLAHGRMGGPITHCATPVGREYLNKVGLLK